MKRTALPRLFFFPGLLALSLACRGAEAGGLPGPEAPASAWASEARPAGQSPSGATSAPGEAVEGALEIGDPYFPGLGSGGLDVQHYDLALRVDVDSDEIAAEARLAVRALEPLASFGLDLYGLEVETVSIDGQPATFERPAGATGPEGKVLPPSELVIRPARPLASGSAFEVVVRYGGTPEPRPDASVPFLPGVGWSAMDSGIYVVAECIGASSWFPCNDHPRDKATYAFRVSVAKPYVVAANGILVGVTEEEEARTYAFEARDPMASYLATVNIAEFGQFEAQGPRGIPVRTYHPTNATEEELAPFRRQPEVLAFLETRFGPYPFEAAGAVLSYENIGGALECQTIPVYGRGCDLDVIVHELAHQWFGDAVSPDLWRDLWLNEGFASYASWLWEEHANGAAAYESTARRTYGELRRRKVGSPFDPGVERLFGGRVYARGAMVLYGLRAEVGDEVFFEILKRWAAERHDANGSTADFTAHAARVAGRDLGPFFEAWLYAPVTPEVAAFEPLEPLPERGRRRGGDGEPGGG